MEIGRPRIEPEFQEKVRNGAYQIFMWGWVADYPDPENFLFLLWGPMAQATSLGPNTANFDHPRFNELFLEMKDRPNDGRRAELIGEMRNIRGLAPAEEDEPVPTIEVNIVVSPPPATAEAPPPARAIIEARLSVSRSSTVLV